MNINTIIMNIMNIKKTMMIVAVGFGFVTISCAQSEDRKPKEPPTFSQLLEKMDESEDGKLSEAEVKGPLKKMFSKIDTDEDGYITEEEFKKAPKPERRNSRTNK